MRTFTSKTIGSSVFLVCEVGPEEYIDTVVQGMLINNRIEGTLPVTVQLMNQTRRFQFDITGKRTLDDCLGETLSDEKALKMLGQTAQIVASLRDYMIDEENIILDNQYIYLDAAQECISLLCLPTDEGKGHSLAQYCKTQFRAIRPRYALSAARYNHLNTYLGGDSFDAHVFAEMVKKELTLSAAKSLTHQTGPVVLERYDLRDNGEHIRQESPNRRLEFSEQISSAPVVLQRRRGEQGDYSETVFSGESPGEPKNIVLQHKETDILSSSGRTEFASASDFEKQTLTDSALQEQIWPAEETVYISPEQPPIRGFLRRRSSNEKVEIIGAEFRVGKGHQDIDYRIDGNPAVSRYHAKIIRRGDHFFIMDTNSKNHTYVNKRLINSNQEVPLSDGASIRFANEDFIFLISG